jgi:hypothetical protein
MKYVLKMVLAVTILAFQTITIDRGIRRVTLPIVHDDHYVRLSRHPYLSHDD